MKHKLHVQLPLMMPATYQTRTRKTASGKIKKQTRIALTDGSTKGIFPSVNHMYTNIRNGAKRPTQAAMVLFNQWRELLAKAIEEQGWIMTTKEKVVVEITLMYPDKRIRDASNMLKLLLDALEALVYDNDYYCLPRIMDFTIGDDPNIALTIYKAGD